MLLGPVNGASESRLLFVCLLFAAMKSHHIGDGVSMHGARPKRLPPFVVHLVDSHALPLPFVGFALRLLNVKRKRPCREKMGLSSSKISSTWKAFFAILTKFRSARLRFLKLK